MRVSQRVEAHSLEAGLRASLTAARLTLDGSQ